MDALGGAMTHFQPNNIPWEDQGGNGRRKILRLEENIYVALIQWDAGFKLPQVDIHGGEETVYVLEGTFQDGGPPMRPGSIVRGDAGSSHVPFTDDGCTFLVVRSLIPGEREMIVPGEWKRP